MGVPCRNCGVIAEQGASFCHECGFSLDSLCASCGAALEPDSQFCGACGAKVNRPSATSSSTAREREEKPEFGNERLRATQTPPSIREQLQVSLGPLPAGNLPIVLGKGLDGVWVPDNLVAMRHLVVLGSPCSGKSSLIVALLLDLLTRSDGQGFQLVIIDDKGLDFQPFVGHAPLLAPVISHSFEVSLVMAWCRRELGRRLTLFSATGCRSLNDFNHYIQEAEKKGETVKNPISIALGASDELVPLSRIVVVIDEIRAISNPGIGEIIEPIFKDILIRGPQAGIHMIVSSTTAGDDFIKLMLGTNCARIGLVHSHIPEIQKAFDNHQQLANGELGRFLYCRAGQIESGVITFPEISDNEFRKILHPFAQSLHYEEGIFEKDVEESDDGASDPLYEDAVAIVMKTRSASISVVQRHLRIGYNQAARLIEAMERAGLVSPMQTDGKRKVLNQTNTVPSFLNRLFGKS